jgi:hypothetical protein
VTEPEVRDQAAIPFEVRLLEILQEPPATTHHLQQAATTVMVVLVAIEMVPEVIDALGEKCDLDGGTPHVTLVEGVLLNDLGLFHALTSLLRSRSLQGKQGLPQVRHASLKG